MNHQAKKPGVRPFGVGWVRAVFTIQEAAEYLDVHRNKVYDLRRSGAVPRVIVPRCRAGQLCRVRDLDRYLADETDLRWRPQERIGAQRHLGTRQTAYYLHLTRHQVGRLARLDLLPVAQGGGSGIPYEFAVEDLNQVLDDWTR